MMKIKEENQRLNRALAHHATKEKASNLEQLLVQEKEEKQALQQKNDQLVKLNQQYQKEIRHLREEIERRNEK
ncbi:hypothetical protein ACYSNO_00250 [Enterococcus sp. LJL98]